MVVGPFLKLGEDFVMLHPLGPFDFLSTGPIQHVGKTSGKARRGRSYLRKVALERGAATARCGDWKMRCRSRL